MEAGYVYLLSNPSLPDLVYIGKTTRNPFEHAAELSHHTGTPSPFLVLFVLYVSNIDHVERVIHIRLQHHRHERGSEFFKFPATEAIQIMMKAGLSSIPPVAGEGAFLESREPKVTEIRDGPNWQVGAVSQTSVALLIRCQGCGHWYPARLNRPETYVACKGCGYSNKIDVSWG